MTSVTDAFTRADNTSLGADWTEDSGDWRIVSNTLRQFTSSNVYRKCRWSGTAMASNNYDSEIDGRASDALRSFGAFGRGAASATVTYYAFQAFGGDSFYLVEITAGAESILDTGSGCTASTTYNARIRCNGSAIDGYRNDVLDCSATDSTLSSGAVGAMCYGELQGTNDWIDNFAAADLAGATAAGPLIGGRLTNSVLHGRLVR